MKLTPELEERIDNYFDNVSAEKLFRISVEEYGFEEIKMNNKMKDISLMRKQRIVHPHRGKGRVRFYQHLKTGMFLAEVRYVFDFRWIEVTEKETKLSADKLVKVFTNKYSGYKLKDLLDEFNRRFELRKIKR